MTMHAPKGTFDILPYGTEEPWRLSALWQYAEEIARGVCADYGFSEIRTPIYEMRELFLHGVGETSDIVTKEMFTFQDKGERWISLRPEGTASVMRAFIENRLSNLGSTHKFFYIGPMFRYERPQSGRYRQHHQFGVEAIGAASPAQDAEIIDLLCEFYRRLGIRDLKVHINTVGDAESRAVFRKALIDYLKPYFNDLSPDSQVRFEKNPLRILDSKDPKDKELIKNAPSILDHLTPEADSHFREVCALLDEIGVPYCIDPLIVRGLDYYSKTVFEVLAGGLGAQNTIGAGGRFDGLISNLGGPDLPAIGFATGLERVFQVMKAQNVLPSEGKKLSLYFVPLGESALKKCFSLAAECRHAKISCGIELASKKMQTALQNAVRAGAQYVAIVGEEELKKSTVQLKNLETREQQEIGFDKLISRMSHV
jgi:histidyl-tRNA synthetase